MSLLPVDSTRLPGCATLQAALAELPVNAPIVIMLHGYRFSPASPGHDPHRHILSDAPARTCRKAVSWPRHLALCGNKGLAIGFGWEARGSIWAAHAAAIVAGQQLAVLIARLKHIAPDRPIHMLGHSLGARVALAALALLPARAVQRLVLLSAALSLTEARQAIASPAGQTAQIINVVGKENLAFDLMLLLALPLAGGRLRRRQIAAPNWLDLPLDTAQGLRGLAGLGYPITPPAGWICHWSTYLRPGVWRLYRALLLTPALTPLPVLRKQTESVRAFGEFIRLPLPFRAQSPS